MRVVVVFRKRANSKHEMAIFDNVKVDDIINSSKRKPIISNLWTIDDIGVGSKFEEAYSKKYKISKKYLNPDFSVSK